MRILIIEEALQTGAGHWATYIGDLAAGLRELGDEVDVITHREATPEVLQRVRGTPWLSRSCWDEDENRSRGALGGITHNVSHFKEVKAYLRQHPPYDYVLALTMRVYHIFAYAFLARGSVPGPQTRLLLLFVTGQGDFVAPGVPAQFPRNSRTAMMRFGFRLLRQSVARGRTLLVTETVAMKEEYERFSKLPFRLFPHSMAMSSLPPATVRQTPTDAPGAEITFSCPGFARFEKGVDLIQRAVLEIFRESPDFPARFVVQWQTPFALPDGSAAEPLAEFRDNPRVEIISRNIGPAEYDALLARTQVLLLPYRAAFYYARTSQVAIEAVCQGIPLVYTAATWLEEVCRDFGAGVAFQDEDVASLKSAIRTAVKNYQELALLARARAKLAREFYSVSSFRALMLK